MFPSRRIATMGGDKFRDDYSLTFDGSDDYISAGDITIVDGLDDFSLGFWVKYLDGGSQSFIDKGGYAGSGTAFGGYYTEDTDAGGGNIGRWRFSIDDGLYFYYGNAAQYLPQNQWHHIVVTYSNTNDRTFFYFNGRKITPTTAVGTYKAVPSTAHEIKIGVNGSSYGNQSVSEAFIYNKELSPSEAGTLYNGREPYNHKEGIASGNLKAWWRMGDGTLDTTRYFTTNIKEGGVVSDESQSSYLGTDLVDDAMNASNWTVWGNNTVELDSGAIKITYVDNASGAYFYLRNTDGMTEDITIGKVYKVSYQAKVNTGSVFTGISETGGFSVQGEAITSTSYVDYAIYIVGTATGDHYFYGGSMDAGEIVYYTNIKVQEVTGNTGVIVNMDSNQFSGDTP